MEIGTSGIVIIIFASILLGFEIALLFVYLVN